MVERTAPTFATLPGTPRPFRVLKEGWSYYEVPQLSLEVAIRQVLLLPYEVDLSKQAAINGVDVPQGTMAVSGPALVRVTSPKTGKPSNRQPTMADFDREGVHLKWTAVEESEDEYLLLGDPERVFTIRVIVSGMRYLPGWYDPAGYPVVHVSWGLAVGLARPYDGGR